jgi:RNA polymerase sigma-70 factor, ECF subfamily
MFSKIQFPSPAISAPSAEIDCSQHSRRHELTNLVLTEKAYFQRIAVSILRNEADAEDTVHTAFCAAWKALASFRGDSSMKTWFTRIVSNHAIVVHKSATRRRFVSLEDDPSYLQGFEQNPSSIVESPEKNVLRRETLALLHEHIETLPSETRAVIALYLFGECSIDTIAAMRGKSRLSVKSHLHRGKVLLRKRLHRTRLPMAHRCR